MITILGIDPGYGTIGYGVVRFDNMKFTPVQYGAAKTARNTDAPRYVRFTMISVRWWIHFTRTRWHRGAFSSKNVTTGIQWRRRAV